jgi:hypothetical protein
MTPRLRRALGLAALAALLVWGWRTLLPGPEQLVRRQLAGLARTASFGPRQSPFARMARVEKLRACFSPDVEVEVEVPGRSPLAFAGREELLQAALWAQANAVSLAVEFLDLQVRVAPDQSSAVAHLTLKAKFGEDKDPFFQELKITLKKIEGAWRLIRVETVKTLMAASFRAPFSCSPGERLPVETRTGVGQKSSRTRENEGFLLVWCLITRHYTAMTDPNQILQAMADLTTMEYGSLKAEYRPGATNTQLGPYYQHQVWEQGRNHSRRIPAPEAPRLQKAIANRQTCEKLSAQFIALRVQQTRRAWQQDSKKNTSSPKSKSRSKP